MKPEERKEITDIMWENGLAYGAFATIIDYKFCIEAMSIYAKRKALLFAEWCELYYWQSSKGDWCNKKIDGPTYTTEELFEIYTNPLA